jgi:hypothetical protein
MAVNATAVWRVRPLGSNTNGGGYDPGISGAGTDYSQQNAAQASGTNGVTTGTTTFVDATANAFTTAMIGNAIYISGTGQTTGFYFVTARSSASTITLDRSPGTGTGATWALGGGWADPYNNLMTSGPTPVVGGNTIYILGSGIPNPSSYTYDYPNCGGGSGTQPGSSTVGCITYANDPATPGYKAWPDCTGGMPCIQTTSSYFISSTGYAKAQGLWFVSSGTNGAVTSNPIAVLGCVFDQFGNDAQVLSIGPAQSSVAIGCEVFSSVAPGSSGSSYAVDFWSCRLVGLNVHDTVGNGINYSATFGGAPGVLSDVIVAKCRGTGILVAQQAPLLMKNFTVDANLGTGVIFNSQTEVSYAACLNGIITNHTQASTFGVSCGAGTAVQNTALVQCFDFNAYYGNTTDLSGINYGPHDTHPASASPYVNQSIENYTLA